MNQRCLWVAISVVVAVLVLPIAALACAVCLAGALGDDPVADAFNWSVLFLMGMPYAVVGSVGAWIFLAHRRAAKKRHAFKEKSSALHLAWTHKESGR